MSFRTYIERLAVRQDLVTIIEPISTRYEMAAVLKEMEPRPVLFENPHETQFRVLGNLFPNKATFADYFNLSVEEIIPTLSAAIEQRSPPRVVPEAPCQEVVVTNPNLDQLPILRHFENDGGRYITSGVVVAKHPQYGQNLDFHRCMQFSNNEMAMRVVEGRNFDTFLKDLKMVDIAVCVGCAPNVLAAAATSVEIGIDELEIANTLEPLDVVQAKSVDLYVPAEAEFVLEGTVYFKRKHAEGPFVDLTETQDVIRQEPVFEVKTITHRWDAIWQALLPGGMEHKLLMGMPREPTIFNSVNQVVRCLDVNVSPGGSSWLHAIVQIEKQDPEDGMKAIQAAFEGHSSCKHVFVVDKDIDIYNPLEVEWALATRFQGNVDMVVKDRERGSSLDPSGELGTHQTTKIGFDLTKPLGEESKPFEKVEYPQIDLGKFMKEIDEGTI
ncbi:MAG: UbiD family decarboxylase [Chloroflexota bacterium]|nr:MAG: UbiD family decarboxylase [Chloroflexota bacterium]